MTPRSPQRSKHTQQRRWRLWLLLAMVSLSWKVLVLTVGSALPRWLLDDGLTNVSPELRPYSMQATTIARALWSGPIERHSVRHVRLVSIERVPGGGGERCGGLRARVRAYTFFAIPYSEVRTSCDTGVVEYRIIRRRRAD
jgi:hypothetical protein